MSNQDKYDYTKQYKSWVEGAGADGTWQVSNVRELVSEKCAIVYEKTGAYRGDGTPDGTQGLRVAGPTLIELESLGYNVSGYEGNIAEVKLAIERGGTGNIQYDADQLIINNCDGQSSKAVKAILDEAYENAIKDKFVSLVFDDLKGSAQEARDKQGECLADMRKQVGQLQKIVNNFWDKHPDLFFEGANKGVFVNLRGKSSEAGGSPDGKGSVTGQAIIKINSLEGVNPPEYTYIVGNQAALTATTTESADLVTRASASVTEVADLSDFSETTQSILPLNYDHLINWSGSGFPKVTKNNVIDHLDAESLAGTKLDKVLTEYANDFPFYWNSMLCTLVDQTEKLLLLPPVATIFEEANAGDSGQNDKIAKYNNGDKDAIQEIHQTLLQSGGVFDQLAVMSSLTPILVRGDSNLIYENFDLNTVADSGAGYAIYSLRGYVDICESAIQKAGPYLSADQFTWLSSTISRLKRVLGKITKAVACIKAADEQQKEEQDKVIDSALSSMQNQFGDSWVPNFLSAEDRRNLRLKALISASIVSISETFDPDDLAVLGNVESKKLFREQCFLLAFAAKFASYKKNQLDVNQGDNQKAIQKRLPYNTLDKKQAPAVRAPHFNASLLVDGNPFGFINRLTQSPNYKALLNIPHHQLSALQPKIRLFKVIYDEPEEGTDQQIIEKEVEIKFESSFSRNELEDVFKTKRSRSAGVGLKSFDFTYDGSNPFAAKKSIKAKLVLFASSFSELFFDREGNSLFLNEQGGITTTNTKYKYVDLALKTSNKPLSEQAYDKVAWADLLEENGNLAKLNFRLKAVVGWSMPPGNIPGLDKEQKKELKDALADSFVTLNLTPTVHNFDFDQQGRVTFEINYLAYVEDFFDERTFNVFADFRGDIAARRELRRLKMKQFRRKCASYDGMTEENKEYSKVVNKDIANSLASLIEGLMRDDKIYYLNLPYSKVQSFIAAGPYNAFSTYIDKPIENVIKSNSDSNEILIDSINQALQSELKSLERAKQENPGIDGNALAAAMFAAGPSTQTLSFFYLSDLVDVVLKNIQLELLKLEQFYDDESMKDRYTQEDKNRSPEKIPISEWQKRARDLKKFKLNFERARILLGPIELVHHQRENGKTSEFVNLGDIPISVKYFMEWISCKVLSKDEVFYPLSVFLNQLINNLVTSFLNSNDCFQFDIKQKIRVNQSVISSYSPNRGSDNIVDIIKENGNTARLDLTSPKARASRPILNISGRGGVSGLTYAPLPFEINYLTFYAGRVASSNTVADREDNENAGLFHYMLGRDVGLVKEIKLRKTQTKGLAEARFEQEGYDGLQQLRVVYDLDITSYANVLAFPGTYIYVPAGGFDPSFQNYDFKYNGKPFQLETLGIGGYYMIIKSSHRFAAGEASTTIYAKWVNSLDSNFPRNEGGSNPVKEPKDGLRACEGLASKEDWK